MGRGLREIGAIIAVLAVAVAAIGGGYLLLTRATSLKQLLAFGQTTPVPTLAPLDALGGIQKIMPTATISLAHPLSDEVDLVTTTSGQNGPTITHAQATKILSLYMRGYAKQTFWRWTDSYPAGGTEVTYEAHAGELWVITFRLQTCSTVWAIYVITPAQILARGAGSDQGDFTRGIPMHLGVGTPPDGTTPC
jgi:hypothetical protein